MSKHTITTVVEGDLLSVLVFLEGERIDLNYNGSDTYRSTNTIDVEDSLDLAFQARGVAFAEWKITLTEGGQKLSEDTGAIGSFGQSVLVKAVPLPESNAASKKAASKKARKGGKDNA